MTLVAAGVPMASWRVIWEGTVPQAGCRVRLARVGSVTRDQAVLDPDPATPGNESDVAGACRRMGQRAVKVLTRYREVHLQY